jgi:hypothetical protein
MRNNYKWRSKIQWGPETDAGKRILEQVQLETTQHGQNSKPDALKKRRTRWSEQTALENVPGIPGVQLPANIAAIAATIDPSNAALQLELKNVRFPVKCLFLPVATGAQGIMYTSLYGCSFCGMPCHAEAAEL